MVEVGLQANVDQYVTTMGQAVAVTKQYTQVADGFNGAVSNLNSGMVNLTQKLTGFNKANTVALDTAASYQKQLSKIEATAAVTGKNFDKLSTTTKRFARDFPIGLGEAVQVMETLQKQGIKSEKTMESLGKSFIKLGAATGTSAAGMGAEFLQLSRTMGNGIGQFEKLSDSLVSTTAKIGGSAPAVVAFSKALAPVASTVGLSQTAVIGLSTAMSKLGEDGFQAANSFNKVLLDMNRSIRDGGPELKAYADLMGVTSTQLKELFKINPAEVLAKFSEAVAKEGPNISRTLDALGFDSVRTTRSLTALARSGGPREAINTAIESYGDGSTAKAAEVAMEGVVDQATKLQESMSQVVSNVGQPLLGVAKTQLAIANQVSGLMAGVTESGAGQAVLGAGGAAGMLGGVASNIMLAGGAVALGKLGYRGIRNSRFAQGVSAGREASRDGMSPDYMGAMSAAERVGYAMQMMRDGANPGAADPTRPGAAGALARGANRAASWGLQAAVKTNEALNVGYVKKAMGQDPYSTPTGAAAMDAWKDAASKVGDLARGGDLDEAKQAVRDARERTRDMNRDMASRGVGRGLADVGRSAVGAVATNAAMLGSGALRVGSNVAAAASAAGLLGPAAIGTVGIAGGMYLMGERANRSEALTRLDTAGEDIYAAFNSFAEATGMAGKGLVSFQAQVEQTTMTLTDQNDTMDQALQLSKDELANASSPNYQSAFKITGDDQSADVVASQAQALLGSNPRPQQVARILSDIASQTNGSLAQDVAGLLRDRVSEPNAEFDYASNVKALGSNQDQFFRALGITGLVGPNEAQVTLGAQAANASQQRAFEAGEVFGGQVKAGGREVGVGQAVSIAEAQKYFEEAARAGFANPLTGDQAQTITANKTLQQMLGLSVDEANKVGLGTDFAQMQFQSRALDGGTFDQFARDAAKALGEEAPDILKDYVALSDAGYDTKKVDYSNFSSVMPENEREDRRLQEQYNQTAGAASKLTDALYGAEKAARDFGTIPSQLSSEQKSSLSEASKKLLAYETNPSGRGRYEAGRALADMATANAQNPTQAAFQLALEAAKAPEGYKKDVVLEAQGLQGAEADLYYSGGRGPRQLLDQMRQGYAAQAMPRSSDSNYNTAIQSQVNLGMQAQGSANDMIANVIRAAGAMQAQIGSINRSAGIQSGAIARDARLNEQYATEDYQLQRQYSKQDYRRTVRRSNRDYNIQRGRMEESYERNYGDGGYQEQDYNRQRERAQADFNRQMKYAEADHNKGMARAEEDYNTSRLRANRDFNLQMGRADRDFQRSQARAQQDFDLQSTRATADYNRGRLRMVEDFNKQVSRMVEDSAKSMYDPFKRMQVQMIMDAGQLVSNLKEQQAAMEKQVSNLAEARGMGLSEQAIKALNLADASNAQQLSRLVEDMRGNGDFTAQLNSAVSDRAKAGEALTKDQGNVGYARMQEDFATAMSRNDEDFKTSMSRAGEDFETSKKRAGEDFQTSIADARADFSTSLGDMEADYNKSRDRATDDYNTMVTRSTDQFSLDMDRMTQDMLITRDRAFKELQIQLQHMADDQARNLGDLSADVERANDRMATGFENSIERMRERAANAISDVGAQAAAQILSMKESFMQINQQVPEDPKEAAALAKKILLGMGIDKKLWGDEMVLVWDAATETLKKHISGATPSNYMNLPGSDERPATDESRKLSMKPGGKPKPVAKIGILDLIQIDFNDPQFGTSWQQMGTQVVTGFKNGVLEAFKVNSNPITAAFGGIIGAVKGLFGIQSPSTVFAEIGSNIVAGLKQGLELSITNVWETITNPLATLDIGGKVETAFSGAKTFLEGLKDTSGAKTVSGWIGTAWNSIKSPLDTLGLDTKVEGAFATSKTFLEGLKNDSGTGTVAGWIGTAWDKIKTPLDSLDLKTKVEGAFATSKTWLEGLKNVGAEGADNVAGWIGNAWDKVKTGIPEADTVKSAVQAAFGLGPEAKGAGIAGWIKGLKGDEKDGDNVKAWIGNAWEKILSGIPGLDEVQKKFGAMVRGIYGVVKSVIDAWNAIQIKIDIPEWAQKLPGPQNGKPSIGFGTIPVTAPSPPDWATAMAMGGIATRQMKATIAEAGYPEAVIPLNQRGAEVLAATMARYVDNTSVKSAMVSPYSTHVVNNYNANTYDQRTQFNGEITVQAQDPDQMAKALQARARRQALAQPVRGRM